MHLFYIILHPNRWFIWALVVIVIAFIVVWSAVERYNLEQDLNNIQKTQQAPEFGETPLGSPTTKLDTTGWKTYRNEEYGFEIIFNEGWRNYSVKILSFPELTRFDFFLPTSEKDYPADEIGKINIMNFFVMSQKEWARTLKEDAPKSIYLGENSQYIFSYGVSQDAPNDLLKQHDDVKNEQITFKFFEPKR